MALVRRIEYRLCHTSFFISYRCHENRTLPNAIILNVERCKKANYYTGRCSSDTIGLTATMLVQRSVGAVTTMFAIEISVMLQIQSSTLYASNIHYSNKADRAYR
jgi:hypothetical protein